MIKSFFIGIICGWIGIYCSGARAACPANGISEEVTTRYVMLAQNISNLEQELESISWTLRGIDFLTGVPVPKDMAEEGGLLRQGSQTVRAQMFADQRRKRLALRQYCGQMYWLVRNNCISSDEYSIPSLNAKVEKLNEDLGIRRAR